MSSEAPVIAYDRGPFLLGTLALDASNNRVFLTETSSQFIFIVDLATGFRTVLSDAMNGNGPFFLSLEGIALDAT